MVANPACIELKRENEYFPCPRSRLRIWSRETGSAVPPRVSPLILHTRAEFGAYSRDFYRFPRRLPLFILSIAIGPVPSVSGHAIAYRWRSLPRGRRRRACSPQGSPSNGCCLFRFHHGPIVIRLSFFTPTFVI